MGTINNNAFYSFVGFVGFFDLIFMGFFLGGGLVSFWWGIVF